MTAKKTDVGSRTVEQVQPEATLEHVVWTLNSALHLIDEVICDEGGDEVREHNARAVEALIKQAIVEIEKQA